MLNFCQRVCYFGGSSKQLKAIKQAKCIGISPLKSEHLIALIAAIIQVRRRYIYNHTPVLDDSNLGLIFLQKDEWIKMQECLCR